MHNLAIDKNSQTCFVQVRAHSAWHQLGHLDAAEQSAEEGWFTIGSPMVQKLGLHFADGTASRYAALVRTDLREPVEYGLVTKQYRHVAPRDFAAACDLGSGNRTIETMGLLNSGLLFVCYRMPDSNLAGEEAKNFLVMTSAMDGKHANLAMYTPVMVVCENTWRAGLREATYLMHVRHNEKVIESLVNEVEKVFGLYAAKQAVLAEAAGILAAAPLTPQHATETILVAAHYPKEPSAAVRAAWKPEDEQRYVNAVAVADERRGTIADLYGGNMAGYEEYPARRGTAWGLLQATIEAYEHVIPAKNGRDQAQAFMFGNRSAWVAQTYKKLVEFSRN